MASAYLLDLTDLHFSVGNGPVTGINRVGLAYLAHLQRLPMPLFGIVQRNSNAILLDRTGVTAYAKHLIGQSAFGSAGIMERLVDMSSVQRAESLTFLRAHAIARWPTLLMGRMLARKLPKQTTYVSIGYGNFSTKFFYALRRVPDMRIAVMIHDTISLDHPEFMPKGGQAWFETRLHAVSRAADLVIYNSTFSQARAEHHMARMGRVPSGLTSPLGVDLFLPNMDQLPKGVDFDRPTFVALGSIEPRKNHALLLDLWDGFAAARAAGDLRPMPQLLILGRRGWRNENVFQRLDASPLRGRDMHELADLPDGGVAAALTKARALLFPSYVEGFGLPALEAAMLSCPVIANDLPVYRAFLAELPTYASIDDPARWAALIRAAAANPAPPRPAPPSSPPTWAKHFAKVLPRL